MTWKRVVLEIGMGTDIRGRDSTKAAVRALRDALWHNSLSAANALGLDVDSMRVEVTIGVPRPDEVDKDGGAGVEIGIAPRANQRPLGRPRHGRHVLLAMAAPHARKALFDEQKTSALSS